jgi:hypothetical protein
VPQESHPEFGTTKDISARFGLKEQTWRKFRLQGGGPPFIKLTLGNHNKGRVMYRIADVEAWLAARTFRSTAEVTQRVAAQAEEVRTLTPKTAEAKEKPGSLPL